MPAKRWAKALTLVALLVPAMLAQAQEGSSGNTTIFGGAQMTFFGDHNFAAGGGGTQPGVINTIRTAPFGVLNFASSANLAIGGDDANYVDGYVRKFGATQFIFPVGDNSHYGPFAAQGDGTMGAYYFADPTSAVTSMLPAGSYPVLPAGGPFPSATFEDALEAVSTIEYWDIDGSNATPITLTWDATSGISGLTSGQLNKLTIAGWNGTQWVAIPSVVNTTSILGGASDLTAGSITSNASIVPDTYTAYTFASRDTPLPVTLISFSAQAEGRSTLLRWETTEETNSDHFEIQRSEKSGTWVRIGELASRGDSKVLVEYSFTDAAPQPGENLYRLKMVDRDGTFAYSRIKAVHFEKSYSVIAYPNPVTEKLSFHSEARISRLRLFDIAGKLVYDSKGAFSGDLNVSGLSEGIHVVRINTADGMTVSQKIIVTK